MKHPLPLLAFLVALAATLAIAPPPMSAAKSVPTYHLVRRISVPGEGGWDYLTADPDNHRLFITRGTHVQVVDTRRGTLAGDIGPLSGVHGVALAPQAGRGFISDGRANRVAVFDTKTLRLLPPVPAGSRPDAIIYDPSTRRVFSFNGGSNDSTAIDSATQTVAGTVALGGRPEDAVVDGLGHIYVNLEDKSQIVEVDAKALTVLHTWPLAPGTAPSGLAIDAKNRRMFSVCDNNKMVVMDADTGAIVATPAIGGGPDACAFDPASRLALSPNGEDGTLTLVHEDSPAAFSVAGTVTTQAGARTFALDPKTHHIFLAAATVAPTAPDPAQHYRRAYVPGSFVLLEYAP